MTKDVAALITCVESLERKHGNFGWRASFDDLVTIIAQVQLALRHPGNKGCSSERARAIVDYWIETLEMSEPEIGNLLRLGDNPAHDVPVKR